MARARGNEDRIAGLDLRALAVDQRFPVTLFDPEKLVAIGMHFLADVFAWLQRHQHELKMLASVEHPTKVHVRFCQVFDVIDKALYQGAPHATAYERALARRLSATLR